VVEVLGRRSVVEVRAERGSEPRLVATDLDGTLVRSDGTVSPYTQAVLTALDERGVPVVFVTGRPLRWAEDVFEHVGGHGLAVISNGALVWDVARREPVLTRTIEPAAGIEVCELIRSAVPGSAFAVETLSGISLDHGFRERYPVPSGTRRGHLAEIFAGPALKLLARHEELGYQEFWDRAVAAIGDLAVVTWSSTSSLLEISAAGVTKATTLALLCEERGIDPHQVIAFGDMPNDIAMLAWAGTSYAMADAHPTVADTADHVAPGNDEDGVARVLASVFGLAIAPVVE
jgi:hydroxymethylpyrimidine pyrophosphatase-like HAD family hydrolase